ncbi:MAG TPA: DUF1801 domain-containing protein, partial [Polyangiaceae bacterium]|nr:DUF1801 domain-containing protein [Polyangiaceae bacterium]
MTAPARAGAVRRQRASGEPASRCVDQRIRELRGWRGQTLRRMRALILQAEPEMTEECKWRGTPVWSHQGIVCTGEACAKVVKLTFARGARLPDPEGLFNSSLGGSTRRAIDLREGERIEARAFQALVRAAVALNAARAKPARRGAGGGEAVELLAGQNPRIAKADGDAPVQAYLAAIPGWKRDVARRLDALIERAVPHVRKAVRWNSPFYGVDGR